MLLTVRKKSSFLKTVETGKWFCKPPSHTCQEQGSFSPGLPELGDGATREAPLRLPKCPMGRAQLGPGRSCGWYQIRHLLMTAVTHLPLSPSSWWKGEDASSPVLNERMQRDSEGTRPSNDPEMKWGFYTCRAQLHVLTALLSRDQHSSNKKGSQSKTHYCTVS